VLSGTPTAEGVATFNVTVTDNVGATAAATFSLTIAALVTGPITPDGGAAVPPWPGGPQLIVEAGFYASVPVAPPGALVLDDPLLGLLDTGTLADRTAWTDITAFARSGTVTRASTRVQGPLRTYQAGTASTVLKNGDARFDSDNLSGPYVTGGVSSVRPMVPFRWRAVYSGTEYHLFSGFADTWSIAGTNWGTQYAETTASATDGFKILAGITIPATAPQGNGELSGAQVTRILNAAQWYTDHRNLGGGNSHVQPTTMGDTALNLLQLAADTEIGELYIDGAGFVVYRSRRAVDHLPGHIR
jgi:hypothetical protein